jgi:hypothetical protein
MEGCIDDLKHFLLENKLCTNSEKTELLLISSKTQLNKLNFNSIKVRDLSIKASDSVKNLGVFLDKHFTMEKQVNSICKKVYFNIKNISKIRRSLNISDTKTVVNALVTPHFDYGYALLYGISKRLENKMQIAQNSAARLIFRIGRSEHISGYREMLHWLPIPARIDYKILCNVWKALNEQAPSDLAELITRRHTVRSMRHNDKNVLVIHHAADNF